MRIQATRLDGPRLVALERHEDERGSFARTWCRREFEAAGIRVDMVQANLSYNRTHGTLRGLHYQRAPHPEAKLVRVSHGAVYDVIVDVRPGSATFGRWEAFELTDESGDSLFVPEGFAHGFQTLRDETIVLYLMSEFFAPECGAGIVWNDPALAIPWPIVDPIVSEKDRALPRLQDVASEPT
jgi:dTDP-4-dehydrorhamnose 3,5-epimerase